MAKAALTRHAALAVLAIAAAAPALARIVFTSLRAHGIPFQTAHRRMSRATPKPSM